MSRHTFNRLLLFMFIVFVGMNWAIGRDASEPNYNFIPEMLHSIPYDAFAANPNFPDGKTLQQPIPNTIARGRMPLYFESTPEDALRAGEELLNPFTAEDQGALPRGARVYGIFCMPCHGASGEGDGPVALRGFPPPASLFSEKSLTMKDGQMFHVITYGQGNMPSYAAQISPEDRWKVILNIRSRQEKAAVSAASAEAEAVRALSAIEEGKP